LLGIASHSWAHADLNSTIGESDASPDSRGYLLSGNIGTLLPAGSAFLDLRVGATVAQGQIDDYRDSAGTAYTNADLSETSGSASAKLLFTEQMQWATLKPFVQAGVTQRFDESNKVLADGVPYSFHEADFSVFGRVGVDISSGDSFQAYVAVRGEKSEDREGVAGQVGFTLKLD
jgi:outer membrane autotransporter protein